MIVDNIKYASKYFSVDGRLEEIFSALAELNESSPTGWRDYDGFRIGVSECETFDTDDNGNVRPF